MHNHIMEANVHRQKEEKKKNSEVEALVRFENSMWTQCTTLKKCLFKW